MKFNIAINIVNIFIKYINENKLIFTKKNNLAFFELFVK